MSIKIGHAVMDENGKISGGVAGDQTGKEVATRGWYKTSWHTVLRAKDSKVAEKIAQAMQTACDNNNIGYDQKQRTTLFTAAQAVGFDLSKVATKCETDCSALVAVCVNSAGVKVSKDIYTGNMVDALKATGAFTLYTDTKYLTSDTHLKRGDILVKKGHTAVVLGNGSTSTTPTKTTWTLSRLLKKKSPMMKGDDVKNAQSALIAKGHSCGSRGADGVFGLNTANAVRAFQKAQGLTKDGIIGKNTCAALGGSWKA